MRLAVFEERVEIKKVKSTEGNVQWVTEDKKNKVNPVAHIELVHVWYKDFEKDDGWRVRGAYSLPFTDRNTYFTIDAAVFTEQRDAVIGIDRRIPYDSINDLSLTGLLIGAE